MTIRDFEIDRNKPIYRDLVTAGLTNDPDHFASAVPCLGAECVPCLAGGAYIVVWGQASREAILDSLGQLGFEAKHVDGECHVYTNRDGRHLTTAEGYSVAWSITGLDIIPEDQVALARREEATNSHKLLNSLYTERAEALNREVACLEAYRRLDNQQLNVDNAGHEYTAAIAYREGISYCYEEVRKYSDYEQIAIHDQEIRNKPGIYDPRIPEWRKKNNERI